MRIHLEKADLFSRKYKLGEKDFWTSWFSKLLFTLISVKVWGLVAGTSVSTILLYKGMISGGDWITFNTTVWALIYGMKEVFRIAEGRDKAERMLMAQRVTNEDKRNAKLQTSEYDSEDISDTANLVTVGINPD